jgi:hypothetical protein
MSAPASISELIDSWPTLGAFADAIGCGYEAARKMRQRQRIAPEHWRAIIDAADAHGLPGVNADWLTEMHTAPRPSPVVSESADA